MLTITQRMPVNASLTDRLNLFMQGGWAIEDRGHFFALASLAKRRILVNEARKRLAQRRGGGETPLQLDEFERALRNSSNEDAARIVEIGILMERLETKQPDAARIADNA